jgi:integrase
LNFKHPARPAPRRSPCASRQARADWRLSWPATPASRSARKLEAKQTLLDPAPRPGRGRSGFLRRPPRRETNLLELIAALDASIVDDEGRAAGAKAALDKLQARKRAAETRIERRLLADTLQKIGLKTLRTPTATLTLAEPSPKGIAIAPEDIPARWWKPQQPKLDQEGLTKAIRARDNALKEAEASGAGKPGEGAILVSDEGERQRAVWLPKSAVEIERKINATTVTRVPRDREGPRLTMARARPDLRWLTRGEAARLLWALWSYREIQKGKPTGRRSRRHVARFVLVALYTGTRASAICGAAIRPTLKNGFIDLDAGIFYRRAAGERETKKRKPSIRPPQRLLAHLRRWERKEISKKAIVEWNGAPVGRINKAFMAACVDAGLDGVMPHTLRHTAVTWRCKMARINGMPATISDWPWKRWSASMATITPATRRASRWPLTKEDGWNGITRKWIFWRRVPPLRCRCPVCHLSPARPSSPKSTNSAFASPIAWPHASKTRIRLIRSLTASPTSIRFRLLMIAAGYEDGNDASYLRADPMFKMALDLSLSDRELCSLPDARVLLRMGRAMVDLYCESFQKVPKRITLDIDDTFDTVHGQQLWLFNAHCDEYGFQPIVVFDGEGRLLRPAKRPGGSLPSSAGFFWATMLCSLAIGRGKSGNRGRAYPRISTNEAGVFLRRAKRRPRAMAGLPPSRVYRAASTIGRGLNDLSAPLEEGRVRRSEGGRKRQSQPQTTALASDRRTRDPVREASRPMSWGGRPEAHLHASSPSLPPILILAADKGWINVGIDHDTAAFAVATIPPLVRHYCARIYNQQNNAKWCAPEIEEFTPQDDAER